MSEPHMEGASGIKSAVTATDSGSLARVWQRLNQHKVLQWGLAYVGAGLAIAHGAELLTSAYDWPTIVRRTVVSLLVVGLPVVLTLAWYHGHRHLKNFSAPEATIVALLVVLGAGLLILLVRAPGTEARPHAEAAALSSTAGGASPPSRSSSRPRLAVMPFENLSPDPNNTFFTDGLHEELLTALTNSAPGLDVISRTTMLTYRASPKTVAAIAHDLSASHVLEGSVRRDKDRVRVTLQLIDAKSDDHIWAQNYDRMLVDAMSLQSQVAAEIAAQLSVRLASTSRNAPAPTSDADAYDLYLKGKLRAQALTPITAVADFHAVEALFTRAIERDTGFALAYAARSTVRIQMFVQNRDSRQEVFDAARADLDAAEKLRPGDPTWPLQEANWARFNLNYEQALERLSSLEQAGYMNSETLLSRSYTLINMGRVAETLPLLESAATLDPGNPEVLGLWGYALASLRRPAQSIRIYQLAIDRSPEYAAVAAEVQGYVRYAFAGDRAAFWHVLEIAKIPRFPVAGDDMAKFLGWAQESPERSPAGFNLLIAAGVGEAPSRAWNVAFVNFMLGNRQAAARAGREMLQFVATTRPTRYNQWFLDTLTSYAQMYMGDKPGALATARKVLAATPHAPDAMRWAIVSASEAPVLAWAGEEDEGESLLEELSTSSPGLLPAEITDDAMCAKVFADNPRFKALVAKLKAQMAATKLD